MTYSIQEVEVPSSGTISLRGRFVLPSESISDKLPVVVLLSGDGPKGTKSLSWTNLPPLLSDRGVASFLFDFDGLGYSEGDRSVLSVLKAGQNFIDAWRFVKNSKLVDSSRIAVFGSSFGATVALMNPELMNEAKLLGLKSPASFLADSYVNECSDEELDRWIKSGYSNELGYDVVVLKEALRSNVYSSAEKIAVKTLISHGDLDTTVPLRQSRLLSFMLGGSVQLEVFEGVGHSYSEEGAWQRMAELFVTWFTENL